MTFITKRRIIILGFMGSGKSTIALALARRINTEMVDLDEEIAKVERRSLKQLIEEGGEPAFREIETRVLRSVLQSHSARVVSLGGGAWTLERNRALIAEYEATTVWLDAPFALCWQRILAAGGDRPLARNEDEAQTLYDERRTAYERADVHIEATENKSADEIAREIAQALSTSGFQPQPRRKHDPRKHTK